MARNIFTTSAIIQVDSVTIYDSNCDILDRIIEDINEEVDNVDEAYYDGGSVDFEKSIKVGDMLFEFTGTMTAFFKRISATHDSPGECYLTSKDLSDLKVTLWNNHGSEVDFKYVSDNINVDIAGFIDTIYSNINR